MKKSMRRLLRRLAKKGTPWEGARRRLIREHDPPKKVLKEAKKKYKTYRKRTPAVKDCRHSMDYITDEDGVAIVFNKTTGEVEDEWYGPHMRDLEGLTYFDQEIADAGDWGTWTEYRLEPCRYCGVTWAELMTKKHGDDWEDILAEKYNHPPTTTEEEDQ